MDRGQLGRIAIVGQGPGNSEISSGKAFSGQSGRKLIEWLKRCGANPNDPRAGIYFTSVIKCVAERRHFSKMAQNCRHFLNQQLAIIRPPLVITLGQEAYDELRFDETDYKVAICRQFQSADYLLMTPVGFHYTLLPWPHPSGLNRWHNDQKNAALLQASFDIVRRYITKP